MTRLLTITDDKKNIRSMFTLFRASLSFLVLLLARIFSTIFFRPRPRVVEGGDSPIDWDDIRIVAVLNHTSLYEWLYVSAVPLRFLWIAARRAAVPVADKTLARPIVGPLFRLLTSDVISVTRQADETWQTVIARMSGSNVIILFPEGRMKRANGLDRDGQPMTVRGGIADILAVAEGGKMLIAYSAGLHHVQVPGQTFPRLFKDLNIAFEQVDIDAYKLAMGFEPGTQDFKQAVREDLQRRRDIHCQVES